MVHKIPASVETATFNRSNSDNKPYALGQLQCFTNMDYPVILHTAYFRLVTNASYLDVSFDGHIPCHSLQTSRGSE